MCVCVCVCARAYQANSFIIFSIDVKAFIGMRNTVHLKVAKRSNHAETAIVDISVIKEMKGNNWTEYLQYEWKLSDYNSAVSDQQAVRPPPQAG